MTKRDKELLREGFAVLCSIIGPLLVWAAGLSMGIMGIGERNLWIFIVGVVACTVPMALLMQENDRKRGGR